jgi:enamine deaminase RidA (YjgF/YER057c/UK114 family)
MSAPSAVMIVGAGDIRLQARQVVANLTEALIAVGAELADVLKTTVYVAGWLVGTAGFDSRDLWVVRTERHRSTLSDAPWRLAAQLTAACGPGGRRRPVMRTAVAR